LLGGADERDHWYRAYQVSEGVVLAQRDDDRVGGTLPQSAQAMRDDGPATSAGLVADSAAPDARVFVDFRKTAAFAPLAYLPQAAAIAVGQRLGLPAPALGYAARLAGLASALGLVFCAIRLAPIGKRVFLLLALTPMAIRQMSLLSADTVTNAAALLLLALCLRLAQRPGAPATRAQMAQILACSVLVSLAKIAYLPFAGLALLCSAARLGGARRRAAFALGIVGVNVLLVGGWLWLARDGYVAQPIAPDADPSRQLAFILGAPLHYATMLLANLLQRGAAYLYTGTGYTRDFPSGTIWLHLGLVAAMAALDGRADWSIDRCGRWILAGVITSTWALVMTLNYLGWNAVGAGTIHFVQGRYFLPLLPPMFLLLSNRRLAGVLCERQLTFVAACGGALFAALAMRHQVLLWYGG
ncbi:MAG: DUF2142 domain-containing protein, partial [Candidatus Binatia bacterium]